MASKSGPHTAPAAQSGILHTYGNHHQAREQLLFLGTLHSCPQILHLPLHMSLSYMGCLPLLPLLCLLCLLCCIAPQAWTPAQIPASGAALPQCPAGHLATRAGGLVPADS